MFLLRLEILAAGIGIVLGDLEYATGKVQRDVTRTFAPLGGNKGRVV
jgi:hypothetical protein